MDHFDPHFNYSMSELDIFFEDNSNRVQVPQEDPPQNEEEPRNSAAKTKKIGKQEKPKRNRGHPSKKSRDEDKFGRPPNGDMEKKHLYESRSYNDIIYHYARLLIFLKLRQGEDTSVHSLQLQNEESHWMSQTQAIMNRDNFPQFQDEKKPTFLLHSNSLHFVLKHQKEQNNKRRYSSEELKFMFLAFLKKRNIFSTDIFNYVVDYWPDILFLVNHPDGDNASDQEPESKSIQEAAPSSVHSSNLLLEDAEDQLESQKSASSSLPKKRKSSKGDSQLDRLKQELMVDDSIAAYEIACYLHACLKKFRLAMPESK